MEDVVLYLLFEIEYQKDIRDTTMTRYDHDWKQGHIDMLQIVVNNVIGK
jgi:hypothetical protein